MSGASLLASRLKTDAPVWISHETVKLSDSISSNLPEPQSDIRTQIEFLITQTNAQERALLRYHAELSKRIEESDNLKCSIIQKNSLKLKYRSFLRWRLLITGGAAADPGNNTDTLRNLALSLNSPLRPETRGTQPFYQDLNASTSTIKSVTSVPFQTARLRQHNSFSLNVSGRM